MSDKKNDNYSDDFDMDFSKKSQHREQKREIPVNRPEEVHIPIRSSPTNRRPVAKRGKYKPPRDTVLLYVIIAIVIMIIVMVVFIINFNKSKNNENGTTDGESSSVSAYLISGSTQSETSEQSSETENSDGMPDEIFVPSDYEYKYSEDDLFIGDSIFTGLSGYNILSTHNVAAEIGFTPSGAHYEKLSDYNGTAVDYAGSITPKHINIMLGSNMLYPDVSYTDMIESYKSLIEALEEVTPNSKICVISVPPVTADSSAAENVGMTREIINTANEYIKDMCKEIDVEYFDLNRYLSDDDGYFRDEYAQPDGLHFQISAYNILLCGLEQVWK